MPGAPRGRFGRRAGAGRTRLRKGAAMKRTTRVLLPAIVLLATFSCATYNGKAMQSIGEAAVVSIQCDRLVDMGDDKEFTAVAKLWMKSEAFDLEPAAARVSADLFGAYARSLPFDLVGELRMLNSDAYKAIGSGGIALIPAQQVDVPPGYFAVSMDSPKGVRELIARFPEVNAFLWVEVSYVLVKNSTFVGTVIASMRADLTLTVLDRSGRGILRHTEIGEDPDDLRIVDIGHLKLSDVASAAARATARASAQLARWLEAKAAR
jgi:hypothetical protein